MILMCPFQLKIFSDYMTEEESTWLEPLTTFPLVTATIYLSENALLAQRTNIQYNLIFILPPSVPTVYWFGLGLKCFML